jgi:Na+/proline symporter
MALPLELAILVSIVVLALPVGVVLLVRKVGFVRTLDDFLIAKHLVPMPLVAASVTSLYIWGSSIIGSAEGAYYFGISGTWIYPLYSVGLWVFGIWAYRLRALIPYAATYIEWFTLRFRFKPIHMLVILYALATSLFGAMAQTTATGFTYVGLTLGLPYAYQIGVILVTILAIIYVFTVGLWGSLIATWILTNFAMILHILTASVLWLAIGGPSVVINEINNHAQKIDPNFLNLLNPSALILYLPSVLAWALFSLPMQQDYWQIALSADSSKSASRGFLHAGIWWFFMPFLATSLGFTYYIFQIAGKVPKVEVGTEAYPTLMGLYAPLWVSMMFLTTIIAAAIGTIGQALLAMGTVISQEIYKKYINKNASERDLLRVTRIAILISAIVLAVSTIIPVSTLILLLFMPLYMAPMVGGFVLSMWRGWIRAEPMFIGGLIGFIVGTYMFVVQGLWGPSMLVAFLIGLGVTVLGSLIKKDNFDFKKLEYLRVK